MGVKGVYFNERFDFRIELAVDVGSGRIGRI